MTSINPSSNLIVGDTVRNEEERIRTVYAERLKNDLRYSRLNAGHLYTLQQLERQILRLLKSQGLVLEGKKILEIGCGTGYWLRQFIQWGARPAVLVGIDLLWDRVVEARQLSSPEVGVMAASAAGLPFADASFDLVIQSTVFTSILDLAVKKKVASEMLRVTKDEGAILWYDYFFNNPWNDDVRGVKKREIRELFPRCSTELRRATLAPPLARRIASHSWVVAALLEGLRLLCTHYVGIIRKPQR
jgi:ubiquinone/menaquinone biosynthesis C-methylase UbiE